MSASVLFDAPGPKTVARHRIYSVISVAALIALVAYAVWALYDAGQLEYDLWEPFVTPEYIEFILVDGLIETLKMAFFSIIFAVVFGLVFGVAKLSDHAWVRWPAWLVVEFFRAVPVLIMMIFFWLFLGKYSGLPPAQLPFIAVVIGLTLYNGSVIAELLRSGVKQLPRGQGEAGLAIGLTPSQTLIQILIPQAFTAMMPSMLSQFVVILKDTALGYIISYPELLASARRIGSGDGNVLQTLLLAAALFVIVNFILTAVATGITDRLSSRTSAKVTRELIPGELDNPNPPTIQMFVLPGGRK